MMELNAMGHKTTEKDPRVKATAAIWGVSVGMLGVCIPLVAVTSSGVILPLLVILGASASTIAIWLSSNRSSIREQNLTQTVGILEERIRNLETICSSLDLDNPYSALPAERQRR